MHFYFFLWFRHKLNFISKFKFWLGKILFVYALLCLYMICLTEGQTSIYMNKNTDNRGFYAQNTWFVLKNALFIPMCKNLNLWNLMLLKYISLIIMIITPKKLRDINWLNAKCFVVNIFSKWYNCVFKM